MIFILLFMVITGLTDLNFIQNTTYNNSWKWVWHIPFLEKVKFFLWIALHKSPSTRLMLYHRDMLHTNLCPICNQDAKATLHCLRDCEFSTRFWKSIGFLDLIFFKGHNLYDWIIHGIDGGFIFLVVCWWLWHIRNKSWHANEVVSSYTLKLITTNYANMLTKCFLKHNMSHPTRTVTWNAHKGSNMILNVDGSSLIIPSASGFDRFIQNDNGTWVHGFANNIGYSNILHVELLALYHGLCMA